MSVDWAAVYDEAEYLEVWCKAVKSRVYDTLMSGVTVEGLKLVEGRAGNRAYTLSEEDLAVLAKEQGLDSIVVETVLSPAKAEKAIKDKEKWAVLERYITRPAGKKVIARDSDSRPSVEASVATDVFDDLTN